MKFHPDRYAEYTLPVDLGHGVTQYPLLWTSSFSDPPELPVLDIIGDLVRCRMKVCDNSGETHEIIATFQCKNGTIIEDEAKVHMESELRDHIHRLQSDCGKLQRMVDDYAERIQEAVNSLGELDPASAWAIDRQLKEIVSKLTTPKV